MSSEAISFAVFHVQLKIAAWAGLSVQRHCHKECASHQIPTFAAVCDILHHRFPRTDR